MGLDVAAVSVDDADATKNFAGQGGILAQTHSVGIWGCMSRKQSVTWLRRDAVEIICVASFSNVQFWFYFIVSSAY